MWSPTSLQSQSGETYDESVCHEQEANKGIKFEIPVSRGASLILISFEVDRGRARRRRLLRLALRAERSRFQFQFSSAQRKLKLPKENRNSPV
jgi:hypothetical protein